MINGPQTPAALRSLRGRDSGRCRALDAVAGRFPVTDARSCREWAGEIRRGCACVSDIDATSEPWSYKASNAASMPPRVCVIGGFVCPAPSSLSVPSLPHVVVGRKRRR